MKTVKIIAGILLGLIALTLLSQAFGSSAPELYEKIAAFFIAGGLSVWLLYSVYKKK